MTEERDTTVLVVDDEPLVLLNAAAMVEDAGWKAIEAANSAEALEALVSESKVDVLFTDVNMPGEMDGLQLAARVHQLKPNIHLVITSGKRLLADSELPGGGTFLPKPYGYHALVGAIGRKLGRST